MNCEQFQQVLPYIIESGGDAQQEDHLQTCAACTALVRDLKYIAEQAKLLLPMYDPNPRVWGNIESSLQREGLVKEGRLTTIGQKKNSTAQVVKSGTPVGWLMALAAVVVFAAILVNYRTKLPTSPSTAQNSSDVPTNFSDDDRQLVSQVGEQQPDVRVAYEDGLRQVNSYISDARQAVERDPDDADAQASLRHAYEQKEMLYQMATARSLP